MHLAAEALRDPCLADLDFPALCPAAVASDPELHGPDGALSRHTAHSFRFQRDRYPVVPRTRDAVCTGAHCWTSDWLECGPISSSLPPDVSSRRKVMLCTARIDLPPNLLYVCSVARAVKSSPSDSFACRHVRRAALALKLKSQKAAAKSDHGTK